MKSPRQKAKEKLNFQLQRKRENTKFVTIKIFSTRSAGDFAFRTVENSVVVVDVDIVT
jgi:hypothetical protein